MEKISTWIKDKTLAFVLISLIYIGLTYFVLYFVTQDDFYTLTISFVGLFAAYLLLVKTKQKNHLIWLVLIASILATLSFPLLSDDYYRFIWDGISWHKGINPFSTLPNNTNTQNGYEQMLLEQMNSKSYFSVYPPVLQGCFFYVTKYVTPPLMQQVLALKIIVLLFHFIGFYYSRKCLQHLRLPVSYVYWFYLNPLIIVELLGNLHFESIAIGCLAPALFFLLKNKILSSCFWLSFAILTKLTPLIFLPFIWKYLGLKNGLKYVTIVGIVVSMAVGFTLGTHIIGMVQSLDLYFQKFEFNASIYYIVSRSIAWLIGYNPIHFVGPVLSIITLGITLFNTFKVKNNLDLIQWIFTSYFVYLLLSTTIHPWYISILVYLSMFIHSRLAILWSGLVILSYARYHTHASILYPLSIMVEYGLLLFAYIYYTKKVNLKKPVIHHAL